MTRLQHQLVPEPINQGWRLKGYSGKVVEALRMRLKADRNHLKTGFVGTPYLNHVLTTHGCNDLAYTLLLNDDYPSWL
ncbi:alpha-L-rhamnosidase-related protein [Paenibacillus sonchi]|uniref:alpha-L-rhamnosidase-related protein n=1 Tax=Paenibacillus sonchi TaxID=373687 RepID=UPI002D801FCB|nr:hypothetical protein [Paenibacillus sonchi]